MPHWPSLTQATLLQDISWHSAGRGIEKKYEINTVIKITKQAASNNAEEVFKSFHLYTSYLLLFYCFIGGEMLSILTSFLA